MQIAGASSASQSAPSSLEGNSLFSSITMTPRLPEPTRGFKTGGKPTIPAAARKPSASATFTCRAIGTPAPVKILCMACLSVVRRAARFETPFSRTVSLTIPAVIRGLASGAGTTKSGLKSEVIFSTASESIKSTTANLFAAPAPSASALLSSAETSAPKAWALKIDNACSCPAPIASAA